MSAIGEQLDHLNDRMAVSIKYRFPNLYGDDSLPYLSRDRRIPRGPTESNEAFAGRLRSWWDDHRTRGGAYALLRQLFIFWSELMPAPVERIDVVYHSGTRRWVDEDGTITRDSISWNADGTSLWAQVWVVFRMAGEPTLSDDDEDAIKAVPRTFSAGHILPIECVLVWSESTYEVELWGYPEGGTWADDDPSPGQVWPPTDPIILTAE